MQIKKYVSLIEKRKYTGDSQEGLMERKNIWEKDTEKDLERLEELAEHYIDFLSSC